MAWRSGSVDFEIGGELLVQLRKMGRREDITLFMILLAGVQSVIAWYTGQQDVALGAPIANRHWIETEPLVGFFVNTLVLRTDLSGNPTLHELLERVRETALGAYRNQDVPFEKLVEELQPDRDLGRSPLFRIMIALYTNPVPNQDSLPLQVELIRDNKSRPTKQDLTFYFTEDRTVIRGSGVFNADLFNESTIANLVDNLKIWLGIVCTDVNRNLSEIDWLDKDEPCQMPEAFTDSLASD